MKAEVLVSSGSQATLRCSQPSSSIQRPGLNSRMRTERTCRRLSGLDQEPRGLPAPSQAGHSTVPSTFLVLHIADCRQAPPLAPQHPPAVLAPPSLGCVRARSPRHRHSPPRATACPWRSPHAPRWAGGRHHRWAPPSCRGMAGSTAPP